MGLSAGIYRHARGDTSNEGLSSQVEEVTVVNADGPSEPDERRPAVMVVKGAYPGLARVIEAERLEGAGWVAKRDPYLLGPMFGGAYVACSDARFTRLVETITGAPFYGAVPLHDRWETPAEYEQMSR